MVKADLIHNSDRGCRRGHPGDISAIAGKVARPLPCVLLVLLLSPWHASGALGKAEPASSQGEEQSQTLYVTEYRVRGAKVLERGAIEKAVYPFLGPERSLEDIEAARVALEKAYHDKGYQSVLVQVPEQEGKGGVIYLDVVERPVGRLRVRNSRYFLPSEMKKAAPSMAEGRVANFNEITRDIVRLNQWPDRQVKPELKEGVAPNTVDIDLMVKDTFPLHGSLELNNRASPDTTPLRLNGYLSYTDLLQMGHTLGLNFQISPDDMKEVKVFSGYYLARLPEWESTSVMLTGTIQDSNISTLGGSAVAGRGKMVGITTIFNLPPEEHFVQSLRFGFDYKRFDQDLAFGGESTRAPIDYFPFLADYSGSWVRDGGETSLHAAVSWNPRGFVNTPAEFDQRRYGATGSFIYARGDLSHQQDLPGDFQLYAKIQGQIADSPLVDPEQITGGGLTSVRGYLESVAVGDNGVFGTIEFLSPSLLAKVGDGYSMRLFAFVDGGKLWLNDPLPGQTSDFDLASYGFGGRLTLSESLHGSIDVGNPLYSLGDSHVGDWRVMFRVWGEF